MHPWSNSAMVISLLSYPVSRLFIKTELDASLIEAQVLWFRIEVSSWDWFTLIESTRACEYCYYLSSVVDLNHYDCKQCNVNEVTQWNRNKMSDVLITTISNAFSKESIGILINIYWNLYLGVQLTICSPMILVTARRQIEKIHCPHKDDQDPWRLMTLLGGNGLTECILLEFIPDYPWHTTFNWYLETDMLPVAPFTNTA